MELIEWGLEIYDSQMIYKTMYQFDPLFDNPWFIDIVKKVNLPLS